MRHAPCIALSAKASDPFAASPTRTCLTSTPRLLSMRKVFCYLSTFIVILAFLLPPQVLVGGTTIVETHTSRSAVPRFTLSQAILTALQRNAEIQTARQEIERAKGLHIQVRAEILPRVDLSTQVQNTDPHLTSISTDTGSGSGGGISGVPTQYSLS